MTDELRILILEDVPTDAELMERALRKAGLVFQAQRVDTREGFERALEAFKPDIVLADYKLPAFTGREALQIVRRVHPEVPVIIVSGVLGDEAAIDLVHQGAKDYVLKSNLVRLDSAIRRAIATEMGIRSRKRTEAALRITAHRLSEAERVGKLGFLDWNLITNEIEVSDETLQIYGLAPGKNTLAPEEITQRVHPNDVGYAVKSLYDAIEKGTRHDIEHRIVRADGTVVYVHTPAEVVRDAHGKPMSVLGTVQDITERKRHEAQIINLNRALRTLSSCNVALVHAQSEEELFQNVCRHIVETGGHQLAWVEYPGEAAGAPRFGAWYGDEAAYRCHAELALGPEHASQCLAALALRTRQTQLCNKLQDRPESHFDPLRAVGVQGMLALPMLHNEDLHGALTIFSSMPDAFDADEVKLMEELAADLAYGIVTLRTRAERDRALEAELRSAAELGRVLEQAIAAIALTLEKRDPYAAGHQQRVAGLAAAIATEMGLPPQQVQGVHLGALLHNIGTVAVPAEILNRPGKLSELQFSLVKLHTQMGYEIVKDIPFPWPVAQMVLQHHERLDGSGYPQGLKGEQIILEARILAVADVLEAMLAYRPYRAALARDEALDTLRQGRGSQFDPAVVDACLRVVNQPAFATSPPKS